MTAILPPIPRFVMTIVEPLSLQVLPGIDQTSAILILVSTTSVVGALAPVLDPAGFVSTQLGHVQPHELYATERVLSLQLGNCYGILCWMGLFVLNTTTEARVVHGYVLALALGDIGHLAATAWVMGLDNFLNFGTWNAMAWGNVGFTAMLFATRALYMIGWLGQDRIQTRKRRA